MCLFNASLVNTESFTEYMYISLLDSETGRERSGDSRVSIDMSNRKENRMLDSYLSSIKCFEVNRLGSSDEWEAFKVLMIGEISHSLQYQVLMQNDCDVSAFVCTQPSKAQVPVAKYDVLFGKQFYKTLVFYLHAHAI